MPWKGFLNSRLYQRTSPHQCSLPSEKCSPSVTRIHRGEMRQYICNSRQLIHNMFDPCLGGHQTPVQMTVGCRPRLCARGSTASAGTRPHTMMQPSCADTGNWAAVQPVTRFTCFDCDILSADQDSQSSSQVPMNYVLDHNSAILLSTPS
jgi:hypothetical protein